MVGLQVQDARHCVGQSGGMWRRVAINRLLLGGFSSEAAFLAVLSFLSLCEWPSLPTGQSNFLVGG